MTPKGTYSREKRLEITRILKNSSGTIRQLSDRFSIPESTIQRWKKAAKSPRKSWATRKPPSVEMEKEIVDWVKIRRERGLKVTTKDLSGKAMELSPKYNLVNFKATEGWVRKMRKRNGLPLRTPTHTSRKLVFNENELVII